MLFAGRCLSGCEMFVHGMNRSSLCWCACRRSAGGFLTDGTVDLGQERSLDPPR